ncbi:MAG: DUF892 family protein [Bacteroidia bacterium]|nr:DUF892 family protein [Bacteroidia bacterium]
MAIPNTSVLSNSYRDVFFAQELKEIFSDEKDLVKEFEKATPDAPLQKLKESFKEYEEITVQQIFRILSLFTSIGEIPGEKQCKIIEKIIREMEEGLHTINYNTFTREDILMRFQRIHTYKMIIYSNSAQSSKPDDQKKKISIPLSTNEKELYL